MKTKLLTTLAVLASFTLSHADMKPKPEDPWVGWHRPVDTNAFITTKGNNHDSVLFVEPELEYPYHLIISHTPKAAHLWRTKKFSWNSADWELVSDQYKIGNFYEYDDGVKVGDTYYIYECGKVFTFIVLLLGLGVVSVPAGLVASALAEARRMEHDDS